MNGVQPFVYISTCGCVFSQAGLKTVLSASSSSPSKEKEESPEEPELELCPQCAIKFSGSDNVLMLNPLSEEEERMREKMELRRLKEPTKKSKKRKNASLADDSEIPKKKVAPSTNPSIAAASRAVVSSLAMEEAKRKANMSEAVKSLYGDGKPAKKETFMTRGTFTRYA
jgi:phenylalanyl-tRNA synthetase beta subunit